MSIAKREFIALADLVRASQPERYVGPIEADQYAERLGAYTQWRVMRDALADFCKQQNPRFDRARWLGYIAGTNGPSGGEVK